MDIIVITMPHRYPGEATIINRLFDAGLQRLHLRKPDASREELEAIVSNIPDTYLDKVSIHSHYTLANTYRLGGIHCTGAGRHEFYATPTTTSRRSISLHSIDEAAQVDSSFDYAFIGPIFDSISKIGYKQGIHHEELRQFLLRPRHTKMIGLGGISLDNIDACTRMGLDGVAILGALWNAPDPLQEFQSWSKFW
jgi:thiamine-phosphate pyrophosphorylase